LQNASGRPEIQSAESDSQRWGKCHIKRGVLADDTWNVNQMTGASAASESKLTRAVLTFNCLCRCASTGTLKMPVDARTQNQ
jgi:hypothetical protein